ncbi:hypothetical protein [Tunturiibacter lichenicola]|uniref:hypothetical protein n=1 Tax=Tunturiibacter lichenicola TaxID=2051959 RepID=UPI0021B29F85|nr:hypothetical protein [Edaphobacter lichenicola]
MADKIPWPSCGLAKEHALSTSYRKYVRRILQVTYSIVLFILFLCLPCLSADFYLIRSSDKPSAEQQELKVATQFYGINLKTVTATADTVSVITEAAKSNETLAVAIEANALTNTNRSALLSALRERKDRVPLLILGVTSSTDQASLSEWSGITAISVEKIASSPGLHFVVGTQSSISQQLSGFELPSPSDQSFYFHLGPNSHAEQIISVKKNTQVLSTFISNDLHGQTVFLLCKRILSGNQQTDWNSDNTEEAFEKIASVMMFTKYCAGERGWHALHHYANLTIDDPWLREPYGNLSYKGLLGEMEKHNFHTTIAFIPWNFDRNESEPVSLFRNHPDRFSVCIHGDNHDHKEFTDYRNKPLDVQVAALRQSVARMEKFQTVSGLPYDRVMVFPHSIAPRKTLDALKANDYLATINSQNVPMDSDKPPGLLFALRPITLLFGDFPSILRYPAIKPTPAYRIAIDDFLDNPQFYYVHQDFFASGIGAFDELADEVNKLQPDTMWRSVGEIAKHLYLLRLREDSNYDVLAFSSNVLLHNPSGETLVFYVRKQESGSTPVKSVSIDGTAVPFQLGEGYLDIRVPVPAGETRSIAVLYNSDPNFTSIGIARNSIYAYALREISDFRDITMSQIRIGRAFTTLYYSRGATAKLVVIGGCIVIVLCTVGGLLLIVIGKRKQIAQSALGQTPSRTTH